MGAAHHLDSFGELCYDYHVTDSCSKPAYSGNCFSPFPNRAKNLSGFHGQRKEVMLVIVVIVIITVVLLISMDRVSGRQTTNCRSLKAADDRFLNRFLHRRSQRRQRPKP